MTDEGPKSPGHSPRMSIDIAGIKLKNPVMTASGTFGYGEEFARLVDLNRLGGIITKGISIKPMEGNSPPRIVETASGMINSIGLQNVGLQAFIRDKVPFLRQFKTPVIVSIFGGTAGEFREQTLQSGEARNPQGFGPLLLDTRCNAGQPGGDRIA